MFTTVFWNIDSLRDLENYDREFGRLLSQLCVEHNVDIAVLIECRIPVVKVLEAFQPRDIYTMIPSQEKFAVIARFDSRFMERLVPPLSSDRTDYWHLNLPLQKSAIISAIHGPDRRNNSPAKQELFFQQVAANISWAELQVGHSRSIVFGDFNSNPFESPVGSLSGMHAVSSRSIAAKISRKCYNVDYPFFYNPMWSLLGDFRSGDSPPGTYYHDGSNPHEFYWHMLDQVLLRPELCERLTTNGLKIITKIGDQSLLTRSGIPDRSNASDHLPVLFTLDLTDDE
jgi:exonuclease III